MATIRNRSEWLEERRKGLGASEAAAAVGLSPWKTNVQLWREKTGRSDPEDISGKEAVQFGVRAEGSVRRVFAAMHPEYDVAYAGAWDVQRKHGSEWYLATLDGRLYEAQGGAGRAVEFERQEDCDECYRMRPYGVLEIKTTSIQGRGEEWRGRVPTHYLAQVLHQLNATGAEFAVLVALLRDRYEATGRVAEVREYRFERAEYADQIAWLLEREREFWGYVRRDEEPPLVLPDI